MGRDDHFSSGGVVVWAGTTVLVVAVSWCGQGCLTVEGRLLDRWPVH